MKPQYRIATEGGYSDSREEKRNILGQNYTKGDDGLRLCPKCRIVWEHVCSTGHMPATAEYYPILPRYGKPEVVCPRCNE